jgi:DUF1680 family protein
VEQAPSPITPQAEPFELAQVRLLDGPFREAMLRDKAYLLNLDPDRLLHNFRVNAGLPSSAKPYGGWEDPNCELRGHSLGHYLSACSLMYASTGDEELKRRVDRIVAALAQCQAASPARGFHAGYLSAFPESFIDRVEKREAVWAPWYTLHKIYAGLLDASQLCGNTQALDVLVQAAGWVQFRVDRLPEAQMQESLKTEFGGMNEVLANLYGVTHKPEHLRLARAFDHRAVFDPLARQEDHLNGLHANTQIPKLIGAAREYEVTGELRCRDIARFGWQRIALHRSYVIGGHSDQEHFFPITDFGQHLSPETAETCNTYNMLKLTRHLFAWEPGAETMDFYERALYNHILASQDPEQGMFVYLMSLKPGHFKTYSTPENSFWCCVGTGMENHAKYADTIYFHGEDALYVNLFIPSELAWQEQGITLRQETTFPASDTTRLTFHCEQPRALSLRIRYPSWAAVSNGVAKASAGAQPAGYSVSVNGKPQKIKQGPGSYVEIKRKWRDGDVVSVHLPMGLRTEWLPGDTRNAALLYGPVVLAGELGIDGMPSPYAKDQTDLIKVPTPALPAVAPDLSSLLSQVEPVSGQPLVFKLRCAGRSDPVLLEPFYRVHHQRYTVYWPVGPATAAANQQL